MIYLIVLFSAKAGLVFSRYVANIIGLLDKPDLRKQHEGHVPLVGGISLWCGMSILMLLNVHWFAHQTVLWAAASLLMVIGILDDRFNLPVLPRVLGQGVAALMMMNAGVVLETLGELLPGMTIALGPFGFLVTLLAVWASINAFNMIDGIDGLLGTITFITFGALAVLYEGQGQLKMGQWCIALVLALIPYMAANLGIWQGKGRKVFMGDAGSTLIGFTVIWLLVSASQGEARAMRPVTALWLIAVPLIDMCAVSLRRLREGHSPFRPDRGHVHHILMKCGLSSRQSLTMLALTASGCAVIGIAFEHLAVPDSLSLVIFLTLFSAWFIFSLRVFRR